MAEENFANNVSTTLSGAIDDSTTSITVASSSGFPSVNFRVLIDSELLLVTNVSGTTWTVSRGAEGTTPASHSDGATVTHILTAAALKLLPYTTLQDNGTSETQRAILNLLGRGFVLDDDGSSKSRLYLGDSRVATRRFDDFLQNVLYFSVVNGGSVGSSTPLAGHPGLISLASGGAANQYAAAVWTFGSGNVAVVNSADRWDIELLLKLPATLANTNVRCGLAQASNYGALPPGSWAGFELLSTDANWQAVVRTNPNETRDDTGVAAVAGDWYRLRAYYDGSDVSWSINDSAPVALSAMAHYNASFNGAMWVQHSFAATAAQTLLVDSADLVITGLSR